MSVALNLQATSDPSENWDDDFDFHSQSGSPKRHRNAHETPTMMRLSIATEDWDVDSSVRATSTMNHDPLRPSNVLTDKLNVTPTNFESWVEDGPSTPQKASFPTEVTTENWDDDFLDKTDSPARRSPRATHTPSKNTIGGRLRAGVPLHHRKPLRQDEEEEHESWDDEFDFNGSPVKPNRSSTPGKSRRTPVRHPEYRSSSSSSGNHHHHDLSDDDDDVDFGVTSAEEDRTVTARSRRAPQSHTPPPPVPAIPFTLTPIAPAISTSTHTHLSAPFPRSPTASVFSVPTSSLADTTSLRSTAPLRPSLSRNSANNALKYLPPSPPIHRERRRLRKKSRPHPHGVIELVDMSNHYPLSDTDADLRLDELDERRTPSPIPVASGSISASVPATPSQSANTGGALLSRIGSVKQRWNSRKKKGSSTPSEVAKDEKAKDADNDIDVHPTPRPRSSLASLLHSSQPVPPPSSSWFFRPTSPVYSRGRNSLGKSSNPRSSYTGSRSESMTDLSMRGSIYASSSNYDEDEPSTPNKLIKRKSLGFVQLRRNLVQNGTVFVEKGKMRERESDGESSLDVNKFGSKRPMSMQAPRVPSTMRQAATQRHASYGTPKAKKPDAGTDDLQEGEKMRERKPSTPKAVRPKARDSLREKGKERERDEGKENERDGEKGKDKEEGGRSFMRRLSLVGGRHKRTKSGASIEPMARVPSESSITVPPPVTPSKSTSEEPPSLPPLPPFSAINITRPRTPRTPGSLAHSLLPPIELQPPSPPQKTNTNRNAEPIDSLLSPSCDSMLSPLSSSSSAQPLSTTTASASSASFPLYPKSPESSCSVTSPKAPRTPPMSPYTASLGRSTISPKHSSVIAGGVRRNSLSDLKSDLKIPARISQAQQGLKRDLGMVRDFAVYIEQLKKQQETYHDLLLQMQRKLDAQALLAQQPAARAVSPSFFHLAKPKARARSNTNPGTTPGARYKELAAAFYTINSKYRISWECAELLVDLADGTANAGTPPSSVSAPVGLSIAVGEKRGRERAITLAGDESKPPTPTPGMSSSMALRPNSPANPSPPPASPPAWRASTGRHDLSHRQLVLLREMLNNAEAVLSTDGSGLPLTVLEEVTPASTESLRVNRDWRWGDPMSSTITLPSEEMNGGESQKKKRRMSKLVGMAGLRDILRALKRNVSDTAAAKEQLPSPLHNHAMLSTASLSTDTSYDRSSASHGLPKPTEQSQVHGRRRPKSSAEPDTAENPRKERGREPRDPSPSPYEITSPTKPRRPSLASIFRLGSRKNTPPSASVTDLSVQGSKEASRPSTRLGSNPKSSAIEEDWDRIDSASDLDAAAKALGMKVGSDGKEGGSTLKMRKGKSPYLQYRGPSSSTQLSRPTTPRRSASGSQLSLWADSPSKSRILHQVTPRAPRLSNVDEAVEGTKSREVERERRRSSVGKIQKSGSVRSMPPQPVFPESKLAMTPENIKPLLENAREIYARLGDCIMEIRRLLESDGMGERSVSGSSCASASGQSSVP